MILISLIGNFYIFNSLLYYIIFILNKYIFFLRLLIIISDKWKVNDADRWSLVEELKIFRIFQNFTSFLVPGNLYGLFSQRQVEKLIGRYLYIIFLPSNIYF